MTDIAVPNIAPEVEAHEHFALEKPDHVWRRLLTNGRFLTGGTMLLLILGSCIATLVWTGRESLGVDEDGYPIANPYYFDAQDATRPEAKPSRDGIVYWFGTDKLGRSILMRCLYGGTVSLEIGAAAAAVAVLLGVSVGLVSGYKGGWVDGILMRFVDVMYGLPYVLLIILFKIGLEEQFVLGGWFPGMVLALLILGVLLATFQVTGKLLPGLASARWLSRVAVAALLVTDLCVSRHSVILALFRLAHVRSVPLPPSVANRAVLFMAIGLVSWLTMARVVRGQVLSLRGQPFIEAGRAMGLPRWRIFFFHLLPNIVGPIIVYATLTVPQAILSESFLSFLGIGIQAPMPTWGSLAAEGLTPGLLPNNPSWWMLLFPCTLLALTLLSLNFVGDGLRDLFDPKRGEAAKL